MTADDPQDTNASETGADHHHSSSDDAEVTHEHSDDDGNGREEHAGHNHADHEMYHGSAVDMSAGHGHEVQGAHTDHTSHEAMFRRRFWVSLVLSIPEIVFSKFVQDVFGYAAPRSPGAG